MSAYANFYIKHPDSERYLPIGSFSRNSEVYRAIEWFLRFEKGTVLDSVALSEASANIKEQISDYEKQIEISKKSIKDIANLNNTIDEKVEAMAKNRSLIMEMEYEMQFYQRALQYFEFLLNMYDDFQCCCDFEKGELSSCIQAGIEWNPNCECDDIEAEEMDMVVECCPNMMCEDCDELE